MEFALLERIFRIIVIDLVLSGDNALVIGMAARRLPPRQRRWAIIFGGAGAIGLRILFTALAAILLGVPLLQAGGGLLLAWIAYKLLKEEQTQTEHHIEAKDTLRSAISTIVLADVVMSLDNMLAVGGAAHGSVGLLLFGLALSMPLILFGSSFIARLLNRYPWLIILGVGVLTFTAADMVTHDAIIHEYIGQGMDTTVLVALTIGLTAVVFALGFLHRRRARPAAEPEILGDQTVNLANDDESAEPEVVARSQRADWSTDD